jgi:hypothetical protein
MKIGTERGLMPRSIFSRYFGPTDIGWRILHSCVYLAAAFSVFDSITFSIAVAERRFPEHPISAYLLISTSLLGTVCFVLGSAIILFNTRRGGQCGLVACALEAPWAVPFLPSVIRYHLPFLSSYHVGLQRRDLFAEWLVMLACIASILVLRRKTRQDVGTENERIVN